MIKVIKLSFILFMVVGCSSPALKTQFYSLSKQANQTGLIGKQEQLSLIVIENIHLADYLRQSGIVVKESGSRLQISANHRWAEGLDGALSRSLRSEIESKLGNYRVELVNRHWLSAARFTIKIEIAQFEIDNTTNKAVHSGRYWIHDELGKLVGQRRFNLALELTESGFEHAVRRLQLSVAELGELLTKDITALAQD